MIPQLQQIPMKDITTFVESGVANDKLYNIEAAFIIPLVTQVSKTLTLFVAINVFLGLNYI